MKLSTLNREDGVPLLHVEAENISEKNQLKTLEREIEKVHLFAIKLGKAGTGNAVGSSGDKDGLMSLMIGMQLGGETGNKRNSLLREHLEAAMKLV